VRDAIWAALLCLTLITLVAVDQYWQYELRDLRPRITKEIERIDRMEEMVWMLECPVVTVMQVPRTDNVHIRLVCPATAYVDEE